MGPTITRLLPSACRIFCLPLHPGWVVCNNPTLLAFPPVPTHNHSTLLLPSLNSGQSKHSLTHRAPPLPLLPHLSFLKLSIAALQLCKSPHHSFVLATINISVVQIHTEEMMDACPLPPFLYLTEEGEDALMFLEKLGNCEAALLDPT